jgi:hypothetical protein
MKSRPLTTFLIVLLASLSFTQQLPPAMAESKIPLLTRNDTAEALNLSNLQKSRIKDRLKLPDMPNRQPPAFARGMMEDMIKGKIREMEGKMLGELTKDQRKRFDEVILQWQGVTAIYERKIKRELKITREQDREIGRIRKAFENQREPGRRPGTKAEITQLRAVLNETQLSRLRELGGAVVNWGSPSGTYADLPGPRN